MLPACAIRSANWVDLRTQVAHETGYLGEARVLGQEEKHAALLHPVWLFRDANEHLRRQLILIGDSYADYAASCTALSEGSPVLPELASR